MAKVSAGDIRNGVTIEVDGKVCQVIDFMHVKPGKGAAFVRVKMKNIIDGGVVETTFRLGFLITGFAKMKRKKQPSFWDMRI